MSRLDFVRDIALDILKNSKHVTLNSTIPVNLRDPIIAHYEQSSTIEPLTLTKENLFNLKKIVFKELLVSSINYCYWYGKSTVKPCNARKVYEIYNKLEEDYDEKTMTIVLSSARFKDFIAEFIDGMYNSGITMMDKRINHLKEIVNGEIHSFHYLFNTIIDPDSSVEDVIDILCHYPGFCGDMFLKRAQLFIIQLFKQTGLFENQLYKLTVPADYQVPKVLKAFGLISYSDELQSMIDNQELIPQGSLMETEIRAATIAACDMLTNRTNVNIAWVDDFLWQSSSLFANPYHLTVTTDY
jgi:hypothetical protein